MSQISSIFECLLDEEEKVLKEHSDAARWAEVVLNVNDIVKVSNSFSYLFINSCIQIILNQWVRLNVSKYLLFLSHKQRVFVEHTVLVKSRNIMIFLKEDSSAHQGCIYVLKNT